MAQHRADDPPLRIYDEMLDKARRAGTTPPEGTSEAMTWAPSPVPRVSYGDVQDVPTPAREGFRGEDGSEYLRVDPDEIGGP